MTDDDLLALLDTHLGEVLGDAGFSSAQGGWDGVTFLAASEDFARSFPWVPQATPQEWMRGVSTDLTIELDQRTGLLHRVHLEDRSLAATLYALGHGALSAELKTAYARPLAEALPVLARALETVFTEPATVVTSEPFVDPA